MRIVCTLVLALSAVAVHAQPQSPLPPSKPAPCSPAPKNWKLGKSVPFQEVDKNLGLTNKGWTQYKKGHRTHDLIREFSDARSRGYVVFRGGCLNAYFVTASK